MHNEHIKEQMIQYRNGNLEESRKAAEEIIKENRGLVDHIINKCYKTYMRHYQDLQQAGFMGILEALETYDPNKTKPSTYFTFYIKHNISEYCNKNVQGTSSHYANLIKEIEQARAELVKNGMEPTSVNIAMLTGHRIDVIRKAMDIHDRIQAKAYTSDDYLDNIMTEFEPSPEEAYEEEERMEVLQREVYKLTPIVRDVLIYKFGLFSNEKLSNAEISEECKIAPSMVRRYVQRGIRALRNNEALKCLFPDYLGREFLANDISLTPSEAVNKMFSELEKQEL